MSSSRSALLALALLLAGTALAQGVERYPGIGRTATPKELAAWDNEVRADFRGLPRGAGSVAKGMEVWEAKCASCHGIFGESNEVFSPIVGGTGKDDMASGRVARLTDSNYPQRTTLMKLSNVSTLWDYIHRAMPWTAPRTLSTEEVYAVTAYILNLGGIVPDNFTLNDANISEVQARLPNRNGKTLQHGLWPGATLGGRGQPDVKATACMTNCATEAQVASFLPDHARNAHGNLAEQQRLVGAMRGADTTRPPRTAPVTGAAVSAAAATTAAAAPPPPAPNPAAQAAQAAQALARKHNCLTCHGIDRKVVGPGLREVAQRYQGRADAVDFLARKIVEGGSGAWGPIPMPAQTLPAADARAIAAWMAAGAR